MQILKKIWQPAGRVVLAAVFVYAAWLKLKQPYLLFALSIDAYGLLPEWAVIGLARTLPWLELAIGLALLAPWKRVLRPALALATVVLGGFFAVMVFTYARGLSIDCGCFGLGDKLGPLSLLRDGALVALAGVLCWKSRD